MLLLSEHVERAQVLDQAMAERAVELKPVAIGAHAPPAADQVAVRRFDLDDVGTPVAELRKRARLGC